MAARSIPGAAVVIYFAQCDGTLLVKIGSATDPHARLRSLQTGSPHELKMARVIDGDARGERWLHDRYAGLRVRGEWFEYCDEMQTIRPPEFIEPLKQRPRHSAGSVSAYLMNADRLGLITPKEKADLAKLATGFSQ